MNDISELTEIIRLFGNEASFKEICDSYQKNHRIFLSQNHRIEIAKTLNSHPELVRFDKISNTWKIINDESQKKIDVIDQTDFFGFDFYSEEQITGLNSITDTIDNFLSLYPLDSIPNLSLDEYMLSSGMHKNDLSFCRILRYGDLKHLCSMGNAFPNVFGIYRNAEGIIKLSPTFENEFGDNVDLAFKSLKDRIRTFLEAAKNKETDKMKNIGLNTQFKQKLACVYYLDSYFPGVVKEYIRQSCARLGAEYDDGNIFNSMINISDWKYKRKETEHISNYTLMRYADYLIRNDYTMTSISIGPNPYKERN